MEWQIRGALVVSAIPCIIGKRGILCGKFSDVYCSYIGDDKNYIPTTSQSRMSINHNLPCSAMLRYRIHATTPNRLYMDGCSCACFSLLRFKYGKSEKHSAWNIAWLLPFSIITGNGHESLNIGVGGALIFYFLMNFKRISLLQWFMAIGFGIGGLFLCLSPASIGRTEGMVTPPLLSIVNFILTLRVAYIFIFLLSYKVIRRSVSLRDFYRENSFYLNAIFVLVIFNFLIGVGGHRQIFGIELFSAVLTLKLLKDQSFSPLFLWIFSIAVIGVYFLKYIEIKKAERTYNELQIKLSERPDGPIFIDFPQFNQYIHPTAFYRFGVYLDYALLTTRNRTDGGISEPLIPCYPKKIEKLLTGNYGNQSHEYLPGEFILMQSKEDPRQFTLHRSIEFFGINIPIAPYILEFDSESHLNTADYNILYLPEILPIIKNEKITIEGPSDKSEI